MIKIDRVFTCDVILFSINPSLSFIFLHYYLVTPSRKLKCKCLNARMRLIYFQGQGTLLQLTQNYLILEINLQHLIIDYACMPASI